MKEKVGKSQYIPARITGLQEDGYTKAEIMSALGLSSPVWFAIQPVYQSLMDSMKSDRRKGSLIYSEETVALYTIYQQAVAVIEKTDQRAATTYATCCVGG